MHVEVRDALADAIVDGDEASFRFHATLDGSSEQLNVRKQRLDQRSGQIAQSFEMAFGNQERMPGEYGTMIQKCERVFIFEDFVCLRIAAHDFAEETAFLELSG